ncbi:hypothetical protein [Nonomuraea rhizosphaerae]|uniref:hypothetical protein n=1 Tax=Nonomuraea rhizosphaerae TaxID=2665663 RepID=UPI001C5E5F3E|nr:hypothetical protein [Nonomuraea rhizosphaerae]
MADFSIGASQAGCGFRLAVRDDHAMVGYLGAGQALRQARQRLERMRLAYPNSTLQGMFFDGDVGEWRDVTDDDLNRIADVNAAQVLAGLLQRSELERLSWTLSHWAHGQLSGDADTREQVQTYARVLSLELTETVIAKSGATVVRAEGSVQGVEVRVSCYIRPTSEQDAPEPASS